MMVLEDWNLKKGNMWNTGDFSIFENEQIILFIFANG